MLKNKFIFKTKAEKILQVRLFQAVMEAADSEYSIGIKPSEVEKFTYLKEFFDLTFDIGYPLSHDIAPHYDYKMPSIKLGQIESGLILPEHFYSHCRLKWKSRRLLHFWYKGTFANGVYPKIKEWMAANSNVKGRDVHLKHSKNGHTEPTRYWDDEFYEDLSRVRFAFCPDTEDGWSMRFFEAIACGAIPIIETEHPLYQGYNYRLWHDAMTDDNWNEDEAVENFDSALKYTTKRQEIIEYLHSQSNR